MKKTFLKNGCSLKDGGNLRAKLGIVLGTAMGVLKSGGGGVPNQLCPPTKGAPLRNALGIGVFRKDGLKVPRGGTKKKTEIKVPKLLPP